MTLLEYFRSSCGFSNDVIRSFIDHQALPSGFSLDDIESLISHLDNANIRRHDDFVSRVRERQDIDYCHDCGDIMDMTDCASVNHGDYHVCHGCVETDYYYSEHSDTYRHNDDYDEYEEDGYDEYTGTYSYDTDVLEYCNFNKLPNENTVDYYGIELEVERRSRCQVILQNQLIVCIKVLLSVNLMAHLIMVLRL